MEKRNTHSCLAFNETHSRTLNSQKLRNLFSDFNVCKFMKNNEDLQSQTDERMGVEGGKIFENPKIRRSGFCSRLMD